jgi:lipoprotein-anchoring transpeptidase ErfK/SrfK
VLVSLSLLLVWDGSAAASAARPEAFAEKVALPAVGEALAPRIAVRARPISKAPVRAVMKAFRFDYRPTVFFAIDRRETGQGEWLKVRIPGRPNGRTGWVRGSRIRLLRSAGPFRIVIDRSQRRLRLYRHKRMVMKTKVAVGTPDAPTPLGHFYLTAGFVPGDDFLGPWAFETSAYAAITDWPRGGIVGLHGTSETWSVGLRASHGCLRVYNKVILALKKRVRPGTPLRIRA